MYLKMAQTLNQPLDSNSPRSKVWIYQHPDQRLLCKNCSIAWFIFK